MSNTIVVFLGDDHFERLQKLLNLTSDTVDLSKSGSNVPQALDRLNAYLDENMETIRLNKREKQYVVFIFLGTNDLKSMESEYDFNRDAYKKIISICKRVFVNVRLVKIPPIPGLSDKWHVIERINTWLNSFTGAKNLQLLDTFECLFPLQRFGESELTFFEGTFDGEEPEGIHLNRHGLHTLWNIMKLSLP